MTPPRSIAALRRALLGAMVVVLCLLAVPAVAAAATGGGSKPASAAARDTKPASDEDQQLGAGFRKAYDKETGGAKSGAKGGSSTSSSGSAGRMIFGLVLVLGLIYAIHWLLKKYGEGRKGSGLIGGGSSDAIEVMATTPLGPNRALHLVRVGSELVLVGATDQSINQLGVVDGQQLAVAAGNAGATEFHQQLQGALTGVSSSATQQTDDTFLRRFVNNLQMMTAR